MPSFDVLLNAFVTLLVTIDPIGISPAFLILTHGMSRNKRAQIALRSNITAGCVLLIFAFTGMAILNVLGVTMAAFRVSGGILLFWMAFEMMYERRQERREHLSKEAIEKDRAPDFALFPLAIPLTAGPGTISATILISEQLKDAMGHLILAGIIIASVTVTYFILRIASVLDRYLSHTKRSMLTRLFGLILAALSVQIIADGLKGLGF